MTIPAIKIPSEVSAADFNAAITEFQKIVGVDSVYISDEDVALYRDAYSTSWGQPDELLPSAAVAPTTVEQVQAIVIAANKYKVPLFPIAAGKNLGYGGSAPNYTGCVIVDLRRMNKIIEVDDKRHFCVVEPGVTYFDLYNYITENELKVMLDCPDPGWGSPLGNALDRGVGYTMPTFRDHWGAHTFLEAVLPNGEVIRTGMGATGHTSTWGDYRHGFGPNVDGLFAQAGFGIVTKMGFWLMPQPEHFLSGVVSVPKYEDIIPLVDEINYLEDMGLVGQALYDSALQPRMSGDDPELLRLVGKPGGGDAAELQGYADAKGLHYWSVRLTFYGHKVGVDANWEYAKQRLSHIKGVKFTLTESYPVPLSEDDKASMRISVQLGVPTMERFVRGIRSEAMPIPSDGHVWFSPIIPRTGEAVIKAHKVFGDVFREFDIVPPVGPYAAPRTWAPRTFVYIMAFSTSRNDPAINDKVTRIFRRLIDVAAEHGWCEYRTAPIFQDQVANTYSFNNNALLRFQEFLKDAVDPNGIISPGRGGVWPKHLRAPEGGQQA